ncbi:MAG: hypothetical protein ACT452_01695 [Microthrixaceae bacterium]
MRIAAAAFALVAVCAAAVAWLQNPHHITASEAVRAAERAFAAAGVDGAVVDPHPAAGVHVDAGGNRVAVWITDAELDDGTVQLWLARSDGASVYLDDRASDGASHLLTEPQFERLDAFYENPAVARQIRRNVVLTVAAALLAAIAACVAVTTSNPAPVAAPSPAVPPARARRSQPLRAQPRRSPQEV